MSATWQLITHPVDDESAIRRIVPDGDVAAIAVDADGQLVVDKVAPALAIRRCDGDHFALEGLDANLSATLNGKPAENQASLLSGDQIVVNGMVILLDVRFPPRPQRRALRIMSGVTAALLVTIVVSELFVIAWLPAQISRQEVWGVEIARQKTLSLLDGLRRRVDNWQEPDDRTQALLALVAHDLQRFAIHLRDHAPYMNATQLTAVYDALLETEHRLNKLADNQLLPPPASLDDDKFLQQILPAPE